MWGTVGLYALLVVMTWAAAALLIYGPRPGDPGPWALDRRLADDGGCRWRSQSSEGRCDRRAGHRGVHDRDADVAIDPTLRGATGAAARDTKESS